MRYLIIPDLHHRTDQAEKIIAKVNADKIIFLGDYLDDFNDSPLEASDTAQWLKKSLTDPNRIHLAGNHDIHYWFKDNGGLRCAGYDDFKSIAANDILTKKDWEQLKFFYVLDNKWLLSHAGFHPYWLGPEEYKKGITKKITLGDLEQKLKEHARDCLKISYAGGEHWFFIAGFSRSCNSRHFGGLLWNDWNDEFKPIRGIHQIVGHTPNHELTWKILVNNDPNPIIVPYGLKPDISADTSFNVCLDSQPGTRFYAIYDEGKLVVHEFDKS
jgi:hypothetical protein